MLSDVSLAQPEVVPFEARFASGVSVLASAAGWPTFSDEDRVRRLFTAPGVIGGVAVRSEAVIGAVHALTDGHHAYVTFRAVALEAGRGGVGRCLVAEIFRASSAKRVDLLSTTEAVGFYRSLPSQEFPGFRLYRA